MLKINTKHHGTVSFFHSPAGNVYTAKGRSASVMSRKVLDNISKEQFEKQARLWWRRELDSIRAES